MATFQDARNTMATINEINRAPENVTINMGGVKFRVAMACFAKHPYTRLSRLIR